MCTQTEKEGIVIIGAGYGGLRVALTLSRMTATRGDLPVILVDRGEGHQIITEIHRVATGSLPSEAAVVPYSVLLQDKAVRFVHAEVTALDLPARRVVLHGDRSLPYRYLVIALGSDVDDHNLPGVNAYSMSMRSVDGARRVWTHLDALLKAPRENPETVVVVGAGWTGTELTGELVSTAERSRRAGASDLRIILLEAGATVMPGFSPLLAGAARDFFKRHGVDLRLHSLVQALDRDRVILATGETLTARTIIWTAGVRGNALLASAGLALGTSGRARVDRYLRAEGYSDVYIVGDSAFPLADDDARLPGPSAQLALHQGNVAAANIGGALTGRSPLPYRPIRLGEALSLGEDDAAVMVGPLMIHGQPALALKRAISLNYLRSLTGAATAFGALRRGL